MNNATNDTLALIKEAQRNPSDPLNKAVTQATGLVQYDLRPGALLLFPVPTPLRNTIPRVRANGGDTATRWKAIIGINVGNISAGVSEGQRGGLAQFTVVDRLAAYKGIGLEDSITFEADYASTGFDDAKAITVTTLLQSTMIREEFLLFGGNTSIALGTTPTPTVTTATTGGSLSASLAQSVICVALDHEGWSVSTVSGGVPGLVSRANADGTTSTYGGGSANKSAATAVTTGAGSTNSISATVAPVLNAVAYAWYWGAAGSQLLGAITTINSVLITAPATGTQNASAITADNSTNSLVFDGILTQVMTPGSGAYVRDLASGVAGTGTPLTTDGAGGIQEIEDAMVYFWDNYRLSPSMIWCNSRDLININKKVIAGGGAPVFRFNIDGGGQSITAGSVVGNYLNKITNTLIKIAVHPNCPAGTIVFTSSSVPYPLSGVTNVLQVRTRQDYYQLEWPVRTRKYEYGVYADELLQNFFPPAFGVIKNIGNG